MSLQTSLEVFRHYESGSMAHISFDSKADSGIDIRWGKVRSLTSMPVQGPSGNMTNPVTVDVDLKWVIGLANWLQMES